MRCSCLCCVLAAKFDSVLLRSDTLTRAQLNTVNGGKILHDLSRRKEIGDEMQQLSLHMLRHYFPDHAPSAALLREIGHAFRAKATEWAISSIRCTESTSAERLNGWVSGGSCGRGCSDFVVE